MLCRLAGLAPQTGAAALRQRQIDVDDRGKKIAAVEMGSVIRP
jgi:hypothetical protein